MFVYENTQPFYSKYERSIYMTLQDLMNETASLGFEKEVEDTDFFIFSANRAHRAIFADRPNICRALWYQEGCRPSYFARVLLHRAGEELSLSLPKGAYTFRITGEGSFLVDGKRQDFSAKGTKYRGLVENSILFLGESRYVVHDFAVFEGRDDPDALPDTFGKYKYDLRRYCDRYLGSTEMPTDETGKSISGCELIGSLLYVPSAYEGEIHLTYRKAPRPITLDDRDAEIDISEEVSSLLPMLTGAYLWLDDEPEKAQYYMNLYREGMIKLKGSDPVRIDARYEDVLGWA